MEHDFAELVARAYFAVRLGFGHVMRTTPTDVGAGRGPAPTSHHDSGQVR